MDFEVYCDESGLEALTNKEAHLFTAIGGIWLPADYRSEMKARLNAIKAQFNLWGEIKWQKVSPKHIAFYQAIIDYFFSTDYLRFRVILVDSSKVNNIRFNNADNELGFYKFYYQLLHHWIYDFNSYCIYTDLKVNRDKGRLKDLKEVLENSNLTSEIQQVQGLPSDESLGIQLADFLTGLVNSKFNNKTSGSAKRALIEYLEERHLAKKIAPTGKWDEKFNVFKINLQGGW